MRLIAGLLFSMALFGLLHSSVGAQGKKDEPKGAQEKKEAPKGAPEKKVEPKANGPVVVVPGPSFKELDGRKIVFVVSGAGGSTAAAESIGNINGDAGLHLIIKPVSWCRKNSTNEDLLDQDAQLFAAWKIANWTKAIRKDAPNAEIYYVGHSAGARIVLAAAEMSGDKSVERIILLSAAVSHCYDLKTALKASRGGIDSFFSSEDSVLERAYETVGMADGIKAQAGGRLGFGPIDPRDQAYCNLRQIRWTATYHGSGGHFTWLNDHNMKKFIAPLFCAN